MFASAVVVAVSGVLMFAAQNSYESARSNLASWAEGLGLAELAGRLPDNVDTVVTTGAAITFFGAIFVSYPHIRALVRGNFDRAPLDGEWKFVFNPAGSRSKRLSFLKNGDIGEGRNHNEWRWTQDGRRLFIWREDGSLQNEFIYTTSSDSFVFVDNLAAKGVKEQRIQRP